MSLLRGKGIPRESLGALIKRGWHTLPDIVGGTMLLVLGIGLTAYGNHLYYKKDGDNRRYKIEYVVMRPDDPKAARVHKD